MNICIIGGGPAGMMAAIFAAKSNSKLNIDIFESNERLGKKILATGNGRCNFTNRNMDIENFHGRDNSFAKFAIETFDNLDVIEFFENLGIYPYIDDRDRVYPNSLQASSILDVLRFELKRLGIKEITNNRVRKIIPKNKGFIIKTDNNSFKYDKVLLAGGGNAMPKSGSDGNAYRLARELGHKVFEPLPTIVQLNTDSPYSKSLDGVKIISRINLTDESGNIIKTEFGDILFTRYGLSGPTILDLSRTAIERLKENRPSYLQVNLVGDLNREEIENIIYERKEKLFYKSIREALIGLINKRLIVPLLKYCNIEFEKEISKLNSQELKCLIDGLFAFKSKVTGSQGFGQAQSTNGGISTKEICDKTMESKLVSNLYLAGEIIDIDGDCGGYNLQWAWSSGYIAGKSLAVNK